MTRFSPTCGAIWLRAALLLAALALGLPNALAQLVGPVIVSHPQSQTAAVGADVTFSISVTNTASLPLTNRLRRAGQNIATNIVNAHSTSFTLRNVQTNAANSYAIGVLNAAGIQLSSNAVLTVVRPVAAVGYSITAESCLPANGAIDPGETVTLAIALSATNGYSAANLIATLEETNGVVAPGGPQTYGALPTDGTPVTRSFTFTANGACGGQVRATLRLFDGANDWGRVTVVLPLGLTTANGTECCTASLADLAVTISDQPEVVALASNVTWTITVTNRGPETAHNVVVTNRLAPELIYLSAQPGAGECAVQQGVLVCQIDEVPANSSWPIAITALANAVGTITNQAGVTSAQSDPSGADNLSAGQVTRLIQPSVRINNTTVDEGETGMSYAIFDVRLSFPIQRTVTVQYATAENTATAGIDYLQQSGTVTFPPGSTGQEIVVPVIGDVEVEQIETFFVNLGTCVNATLATRTGTCAILPDEMASGPLPPPNTVQQLWSVVTSNFLTVAVVVDAVGNAYSAGTLSNITGGTTNVDYGLVKYDENGSVVWVARYGKPGPTFNEQPAAMALDSWGVYVTGSAGTVKFDPEGNELWVSTNLPGIACAVDPDGNLCVAGAIGVVGRKEVGTVKLAPDGTTLWDRRYKTPLVKEELPVALAVDRDGSICVAGVSSMAMTNGGIDPSFLVIKYDSRGNLLWSDRWNTNFADPTSMAMDHVGDVYLTGRHRGDITTRKYRGADGVPLWTARHFVTSPDDWPCRIAVDAANNNYVAGTENDEFGDSTRPTPTTIKYDRDGNELWVARFSSEGGLFYAIDMAVDQVGNVYVAGQASLAPYLDYQHVIWMLDADGYRRWVNYSEGRYTWSWVPYRDSPFIALNGSGRVWMASRRPHPLESSRLVSLLPSVGLGLPQIDGPLIFQTNGVGEISVKAEASGDPPLHYQWYTYSLGSPNPQLNATNSAIALGWPHRPPDHIVISNRLGSVATPSLPRVSLDAPPVPVTVAQGDRFTLLSAHYLDSGAAYSYQWYSDYLPIPEATNGCYAFTNAQSGTSAELFTVSSYIYNEGKVFNTSRVARVTVAAQLLASLSEVVVTNSSTSSRDGFGNAYDVWSGSGNGSNTDVLVTKSDASGRYIWTSRYSTSDYNAFENGPDVITAVITDLTGNVWIGGYSQIRPFTFYYAMEDQPFVLKFNPEGTLSWVLTRGLATPREPGPFLALSSEGDLLVSGRGFGNVRYREVPVAGLPTLVSRPQDRVVDADEAVTLAVEAQGQGPLFYRWRKDGVFMPGATNAALEFAAVQFEDAGDYSVEIRNQLGTIHTAEARLSVQSPPKIRQQPGDAVVLAGARLTFTAVAVGSPPLAYQWRFNDVPLAGATNNSLLITNVTPAVTGFYTLVVTNAYGAVTSAPARLEIWQPPVVEDSVGRTNVPLGGSIELAIEANGTPPLRYQWRRNGVNIPGATNFTYTINQARLSDGGTYTVLVANGAGAVISSPILVIIEVPQQPAGDDFVNRTLVTGVTNAVGGTNRWATREVGEPLHAGKFGSNSVWYRWVAPVSGIATFRTVGSTFDTLLGVYTGTNVTALTAVAEDEDRGGFFTSELRFNAEQGVDYAIAIDGFFGQQGSFILTWEVETTAQSLPVVTTQPQSQTVRAGAGVLLQVAATGVGLTYQWHFNGTRIAGASGAAFAVNNVQPANVGLYTVAITNNAGRGIESLPAAIEIGPVPAVQGQDKLEDLFGDTPPLGGGIIAAALPSTFISVSAGTVDYQITSTRDATTQTWEPNHCNVIGGASKWFEFHAIDDATVMIDTRGSTFDTVLAVYRKVGVLQLAQNRIDCSTDWQPGANWSRVSFQAQRNASYYVVVDGANVNDLTGRAQLNWAMGRQPTIATAPQFDLVRPGQRWRFSAGVTNAIPPPTYRWYHNGRLILGATNDWFELVSLQLTNAGIYTVAVSNALGEAQQLIAQLTAPTLTSELRVTDGTYRLTLAPVEQPGAATLLESSTNLVDWTPVQVHTNTAAPVTLTLPLNSTQRFFRTRPVE